MKKCVKVRLYVIIFKARQRVKLNTKAKQAIHYCSTSESLLLSLKEQYLIITVSISLSTI